MSPQKTIIKKNEINMGDTGSGNYNFKAIYI